MMLRNIHPLYKPEPTQEISDEDYAILHALSGMYCSVCDAPLSTEDKQVQHRYYGYYGEPRPYSAYTCCHQAHCPFCGANAKERCCHLLALHTHGRWYIHGFPDSKDFSLLKPPPVSATNLLDYSEEQKQQAFGEIYPLLNELYNPGWRNFATKPIDGSDIMYELSNAENRQDIPIRRGPVKQSYFGTNPDAAAQHIRWAFTVAPQEGFARLLAEIPPGSEFVERIISLQGQERGFQEDNSPHIPFDWEGEDNISFDWEADTTNEPPVFLPQNSLTAAAFSPCGQRFALVGPMGGEIWDRQQEPGNFPLRFFAGDDLQFRSVKYSPDGQTIWTRCASFDIDRDVTQIRSAEDGCLIAVVPEYGDVVQEMGACLLEEPLRHDGFLHGGATFLTVRGRCIRLFAVRHEYNNWVQEPYLTLTLRVPISQLAIAPDGETFITTADSYAVVWRIPRVAVSGG